VSLRLGDCLIVSLGSELELIRVVKMLLERFRLIFSLRQKVSELSYFTPFQWNTKTQALSLTSDFRFIYWPSVHVYLTFYGLGTLYRIICHVWSWKFIVNFDKIGFAGDILFVDLVTLFLKLLFLILLRRLENVQLLNHLLQLDKQFEGKSQSSII